MSAPSGIGMETLHRREKHIARAERKDRHAGLVRARSHQRSRIVAGERQDGDSRPQTVFREVPAKPHRSVARAGHDFRKPAGEIAGDGVAKLPVPRKRVQIEEVHARAVSRIHRRIFAGEYGREEGRNEMNAPGCGVALRLASGELHYLRAGKALYRRRAGAPLQRLAVCAVEDAAFLACRCIHPNRRSFPRQARRELFAQLLGWIERGERALPAAVQIYAAMLLAVAADSLDLRYRKNLLELREDEIERRQPHERIGVANASVRAWQEAVGGAELRQLRAEIHAGGSDCAPLCAVVNERLDALRRGIYSECVHMLRSVTIVISAADSRLAKPAPRKRGAATTRRSCAAPS